MSSNLDDRSVPELSCIVSLVCQSDTLGALRRMLLVAARLGASDELELVDGGAAYIETVREQTHDPVAETVGYSLRSLRRFAEAVPGLGDETLLIHGTTICVDLPVVSISLIGCGQHRYFYPENVHVVVNPQCGTNDSPCL